MTRDNISQKSHAATSLTQVTGANSQITQGT